MGQLYHDDGSRIYTHTGGCDWTSTTILHLIDAPDSTQWHNYHLNVAAELDNLPAVNRNNVRKVRIGLWSYNRNNC